LDEKQIYHFNNRIKSFPYKFERGSTALNAQTEFDESPRS